jgi:hypothetical protein
MDESQKSRSEKLDTTLEHMETDMHHLASRLLEIAVVMQRLEVKLDRIAESGTSDKRPQLPQKCDSASQANFQDGVVLSMGSQASAISAVERSDSHMKRTRKDVEPAGTVVIWNNSSQDSLDADRLVEKSISESRLAHSKVMDNTLDGLGTNDTKPASPPGAANMLPELDLKFGIIDRKLERISTSLGIKSGTNEGDDEEDRRRLKEKLKAAIEVDRRSRVLTIVSRSEMWIEYIFGICSPDQRIGKSGSRWQLHSNILILAVLLYCMLF